MMISKVLVCNGKIHPHFFKFLSVQYDLFLIGSTCQCEIFAEKFCSKNGKSSYIKWGLIKWIRLIMNCKIFTKWLHCFDYPYQNENRKAILSCWLQQLFINDDNLRESQNQFTNLGLGFLRNRALVSCKLLLVKMHASLPQLIIRPKKRDLFRQTGRVKIFYHSNRPLSRFFFQSFIISVQKLYIEDVLFDSYEKTNTCEYPVFHICKKRLCKY